LQVDPEGWKQPDAKVPNKKVQDFLRGPEQSMTLELGKGLTYVRRFIRELNYSAAKFKEGGRGKAAFVTITKLPFEKWTEPKRAKKELQKLKAAFPERFSRKRAKVAK